MSKNSKIDETENYEREIKTEMKYPLDSLILGRKSLNLLVNANINKRNIRKDVELLDSGNTYNRLIRNKLNKLNQQKAKRESIASGSNNINNLISKKSKINTINTVRQNNLINTEDKNKITEDDENDHTHKNTKRLNTESSEYNALLERFKHSNIPENLIGFIHPYEYKFTSHINSINKSKGKLHLNNLTTETNAENINNTNARPISSCINISTVTSYKGKNMNSNNKKSSSKEIGRVFTFNKEDNNKNYNYSNLFNINSNNLNSLNNLNNLNNFISPLKIDDNIIDKQNTVKADCSIKSKLDELDFELITQIGNEKRKIDNKLCQNKLRATISKCKDPEKKEKLKQKYYNLITMDYDKSNINQNQNPNTETAYINSTTAYDTARSLFNQSHHQNINININNEHTQGHKLTLAMKLPLDSSVNKKAKSNLVKYMESNNNNIKKPKNKFSVKENLYCSYLPINSFSFKQLNYHKECLFNNDHDPSNFLRVKYHKVNPNKKLSKIYYKTTESFRAQSAINGNHITNLKLTVPTLNASSDSNHADTINIINKKTNSINKNLHNIKKVLIEDRNLVKNEIQKNVNKRKNNEKKIERVIENEVKKEIKYKALKKKFDRKRRQSIPYQKKSQMESEEKGFDGNRKNPFLALKKYMERNCTKDPLNIKNINSNINEEELQKHVYKGTKNFYLKDRKNNRMEKRFLKQNFMKRYEKDVLKDEFMKKKLDGIFNKKDQMDYYIRKINEKMGEYDDNKNGWD